MTKHWWQSGRDDPVHRQPNSVVMIDSSKTFENRGDVTVVLPSCGGLMAQQISTCENKQKIRQPRQTDGQA